jgi:hypothetical protein
MIIGKKWKGQSQMDNPQKQVRRHRLRKKENPRNQNNTEN